MNREVCAAVAAALERGEAAALVTIVSTRGSTPQRVGAKMLVFANGRIVGTIGGGCYETDAFWKAREAITHRRPQLVHYELSDDFAQATGLICGGQMDVCIEPIAGTLCDRRRSCRVSPRTTGARARRLELGANARAIAMPGLAATSLLQKFLELFGRQSCLTDYRSQQSALDCLVVRNRDSQMWRVAAQRDA